MTRSEVPPSPVQKILNKIQSFKLNDLKLWLTIDHWRKINPYHFISPILFLIKPEQAHELTIKFLSYRLLPKIRNNTEEILATQVCGLKFPSPIGLAAGFDKNAQVINEVINLGFGYTEIGSITPRPQPGNPSPRVFRATESQAVINRYGFNSDGIDVTLRRVTAWYDEHPAKSRGILGINLGKNKDSQDAAADYIIGLEKFSPYASYIAINISSPNTKGLRDLQGRDLLSELLQKIMDKHSRCKTKPPLFVKISPDQSEKELDDIAEVALKSGIHGLIVSNTTLSRPTGLPADFSKESGGLSGKPLFKMSTDTLRRMYKLTGGKLPLIGCGGVFNAEDAYEKIQAGASLIQLYTGLVYEGPLIAQRINRRLAQLLKKDGFKSVQEAVGSKTELN